MTENGANGTLAGNRDAMDRFIERLRDSGNVRASCIAAGVPRRTAYNWRARWKTFEAEWDEAIEDACDILEAEAWKRAVKENSDRLLMFLLKAYRPDKFKERSAVELDGEVMIKKGYTTLASPDQWDDDDEDQADSNV